MHLFTKSPAHCPCEPEQKQWIDQSFDWLIQEFGIDILRNYALVLPEKEFFNFEFKGDERTADKVVTTVCKFYGVDQQGVKAVFVEERAVPLVFLQDAPYVLLEHAGDDISEEGSGEMKIALPLESLTDPIPLIAAAAHEIAHIVLKGRSIPNQADEPMSDLVTVYYGFGVFNGDAALVFRKGSNTMRWGGWSSECRGCLTQPMFAYALALYAYLRYEQDPQWTTYMELGLKLDFELALKYLQQTGDTPLSKHLS